jgi:hypothetical protein
MKTDYELFEEILNKDKELFTENFIKDNPEIIKKLIKSANTFQDSAQNFKDDLYETMNIAKNNSNTELADFIYKRVLPKLPELLGFGGIMVKMQKLMKK